MQMYLQTLYLHTVCEWADHWQIKFNVHNVK